MKKHVVIVHGYTGHPNKNWFPWLKAELEERGFTVDVPAMPHTDAPQLNEWLPHLQKIVGEPTAETYLVGHSLGCITIMRYLETLPEGVKIGGAVLVAGFSRPIHFTELNNFFTTPVDFAKCRAAARAITAIHSDTDEHVPLEDGEIIRDQLDAKLIVLSGAGHINEKSGFKEVPFVLEELLAMSHE